MQLNFENACEALRAAGYTIEPSDIPGLTLVDGKELTISQVINLAFGSTIY